ncbi:MAG: efflux RND transporter periplasmic adaptor subunit [Inhella sp.]|jgi:RND family efflux transporter MFP subunit|uniref:efflux RND transporter periplasmic adaptor subunit n=1 Tax=Inhella sp. TaxID=1921806 RepID=UPI0022BAFD8C|nr:efflux RND transporter periplasmic adaptor subunit [Inhella sp.]MCZ8235879.1 efflux RND transporter periplasmic adaptor subunit [Inhella sp.]
MGLLNTTTVRQRRWAWGAGLGAIALAAVATAVLARGQGDATQDEKKLADKALRFNPSEVVQPQLAKLAARIEFSGPLVAPNTATVRAKGGGTLLALNAPEGTRVRAGQAIGSLDLEDLRQRVAERAAGVEAVRAQAVQAERTHAANESLARQNFIAPTALDSSRAALDTQRAQLAAAQAQLQTMQVALRQASLTAPISGWVAKRHAVPGEKLQAEQPVVTVVDLSQLELAGLVGTHEVARLKPGMAAQVRIEGVAEPVTARIARISPAAEPGTRSIGVTLSLPNPGEALRAGQYALATVTLDDPEPRLTVPVSALVGSDGQQQVWLIEQGELKRRLVTTGRRDAQRGRVEVLKGLTPEAQVLAGRYDNLREGAKATVDTKPAAQAAAATPQAGG